MLQSKIKEAIEKLDNLSKTKPIKIISHHDTDGITSAAVFSKALQRWEKSFSLEIVKNLENGYIEKLNEDQILIFLDLASGSLPLLSKKNTEIFILDHHEIPDHNDTQTTDSLIPENVTMINPHLLQEENIASSALCYLFAISISEQNKDLANLAIIGMIGDVLEKHIGKIYSDILKDAEVTVKKGLLLYPATRPIDKVLEYSSSPYIPGISGSFKGTLEVLKEAGISKSKKGYKSLSELTDQEMADLTTAISLRAIGENTPQELVGNIYLIKFFNTIEDARELSGMINACSRMECPEISLGFCLGNKEIKKQAGKIHAKYKRTISSALEQIPELINASGKDYVIINAQDKIKDTMIGTISSIISFSPLYSEGTVIIGLAYTQNEKIKVSARLAGRKGRNIREILHRAILPLSENGETEVGGHPVAAGCLVPKDKETEFIDNLKQTLEIELVKV
jgi:single-stranded-DNA-specific exonuclease